MKIGVTLGSPGTLWMRKLCVPKVWLSFGLASVAASGSDNSIPPVCGAILPYAGRRSEGSIRELCKDFGPHYFHGKIKMSAAMHLAPVYALFTIGMSAYSMQSSETVEINKISVSEIVPLSKAEVERLSLVMQARLEGIEPVEVSFVKNMRAFTYGGEDASLVTGIMSGQRPTISEEGTWRQFRQSIYCEYSNQDSNPRLPRSVWGSGNAFNTLDSIVGGGLEKAFSESRRLPFAFKSINSRVPPPEAGGIGFPGEILLSWYGFPLHRQITQFGDPAKVTSAELESPGQTLYLFDQEPGVDGGYGAPVLIGWDGNRGWVSSYYVGYRRISEMGGAYSDLPRLEIERVAYPLSNAFEIVEWRVLDEAETQTKKYPEVPSVAARRGYYISGKAACTEVRLEMRFQKPNSQEVNLEDWLKPASAPWALVLDGLTGEEWFESAGKRIAKSDFLVGASQDAAHLSLMLGRPGYIQLADADIHHEVSCGIPAVWLFLGLMGSPRTLSDVCAAFGEMSASDSLSLEDLRTAAATLGVETIAAKIDRDTVSALNDPTLVQLSGEPYSEPHFAVMAKDAQGFWIASPPDRLKLLGRDIPDAVFTGFCLLTPGTAASLGLLPANKAEPVADGVQVPLEPSSKATVASKPGWSRPTYLALACLLAFSGLILHSRRAARKKTSSSGSSAGILFAIGAALNSQGCDSTAESAAIGQVQVASQIGQRDPPIHTTTTYNVEAAIGEQGKPGLPPQVTLIEGVQLTDLGLVDKGSVVTLRYRFVNSTANTIHLEGQNKSCSCTEVTFEPPILLPEEQGTLILESVIDQNAGTLVTVSGAVLGSYVPGSSDGHPIDGRLGVPGPQELLRVFVQCKVVLGRSIYFEASPIQATGLSSSGFQASVADVVAKAKLRPADAWPDPDSIRFETSGPSKLSIPYRWLGEGAVVAQGDLLEWHRPCRLLLPAELSNRPDDFSVRIEGTIEGARFSNMGRLSNPGTREAERLTKSVLIGDISPSEPKAIDLVLERGTHSEGRRSFSIEAVEAVAGQTQGALAGWRILQEGPEHVSLELIPAPGEGRLELIVVCREGGGASAVDRGRWRLLGWVLPSSTAARGEN